MGNRRTTNQASIWTNPGITNAFFQNIKKYHKWELPPNAPNQKFQVYSNGNSISNSKYHKWELHIKSLSITNGNSISRVSQMGTPYKNSRYHKWEFHIKIPGITNGNSISKFQVSQMPGIPHHPIIPTWHPTWRRTCAGST